MIIKSALVTALGLTLTAPEDARVSDLGDAVRIETTNAVTLACNGAPFSSCGRGPASTSSRTACPCASSAWTPTSLRLRAAGG